MSKNMVRITCMVVAGIMSLTVVVGSIALLMQ